MSIPDHSPYDPTHCVACKVAFLEQRVKELEAAQSGPRFVTARAIAADSWLQDERYTWFRKAHGYAGSKTNAISGLAAIHPTELYYVFIFMARDMGFEVVDGKLVALESPK